MHWQRDEYFLFGNLSQRHLTKEAAKKVLNAVYEGAIRIAHMDS
jgi:hypothetical protein